jgi:predicted small lipoprotein YifL
MPSMMRPALAASLLALSLALAGCGQPQPAPAEAPAADANTPLTQEPIDATPLKSTPAPTPSSTPAPAPAAPPAIGPVEKPTSRTTIPEAWDIKSGDIAPSCLAEIGEARSKRLVERCIAVSPATRPPCNSANPCILIQGEIDRSCAMYGPDEAKPKECAA